MAKSQVREALLKALEELDSEMERSERWMRTLQGLRATLRDNLDDLDNASLDLQELELANESPLSQGLELSIETPASEPPEKERKETASDAGQRVFSVSPFSAKFFRQAFGGSYIPQSVEEVLEQMYPQGLENVTVNVFRGGKGTSRERVDISLREELDRGEGSQKLKELRTSARKLWAYNVQGSSVEYRPSSQVVYILGCMSNFPNGEVEQALKRMKLL